MRIQNISVRNVLHFDDYQLNFGNNETGLHILYGPNETGKSTLLKVINDLLFGAKIENPYTSKSVIEGKIEHTQFQSIHLMRKSRYKKLVAYDQTIGDELSEEKLSHYLGKFNKEQFNLLFGFNHDVLREGGQSLLHSEGHAGISLFETGGGIQHLQALLNTLSNQTKDLLDPRFSANAAKQLNKAWRLFKEAEEQIKKSSIHGEEWTRLKGEINSIEKSIQLIRKKVESLSREIAKLERIKRISNRVIHLWKLREQRNSLKDIKIIPDAMIEQIQNTLNKFEQNKFEKTRLSNLIKRKEEELNLINRDPEIIALLDKMNKLSESLQKYVTYKNEDQPNLEKNLDTTKRELSNKLRLLSPNLLIDDIESLRISFTDEEEIIQLSKRLQENKSELKTSEERYEEIEAKIKETEQRIAHIGNIKDVTILKSLIQEITAKGDIEELIKQKYDSIQGKRASINNRKLKQSLYSGEIEELLILSIPLNETIEFYAREFHQFSNEIQDYYKTIKSKKEELQTIIKRLEELELSGKIPVEEELIQSRERRNLGWNLVKNAWLKQEYNQEKIKEFAGNQDLAIAFEEALQISDEISDQMRKESERSAKKANWLLQKEQLERDIERFEQALTNKEQEFDALQKSWVKEWKTSTIHVKSPAEMKEWIANFYTPIIEEIRLLQQLTSDYENLLLQKEQYITNLKNILIELGIHGIQTHISIRTLISYGQNIVSENEDLKRKFESYQSELIELKETLNERKSALFKIRNSYEELENRWETMREKYPTLPETPEIASNYIYQLRELFRLLSNREEIQKNLERIQESCSVYEQEVIEIANKLGDSLSNYPSIESYVRHLKIRLNKANDSEIEYERIKKDMNQFKSEQGMIESELEAIQLEINQYLEKNNCNHPEELLVKISKSNERKKIEGELYNLENMIIESGDQLSLEQLESEVRDYEDLTLIPLKIEELKMDRSIHENELNIKQIELGQKRQKFNEMNNDLTDSTKYALEAEQHLSDVDRYWNEYLRLELARRLLQRAIDQFREQNESTIIHIASQYFSKLTVGRYQGLAVEYDDVQNPYLEAIHSDGTRRRVNQMSDGTRDQLFLSMRLAFIDQHLNDSEPMPLIMDDILIHFDDARTKATLELLSELSKRTQILYFTHHQAIVHEAKQLNRNTVVIHDLQNTETLSLN